MASVFKPAGKSRYVILYFDENGRRRKKVGTTDKAVTERIARDLENRVALRREGLVDPREEAFRDHEARLLSDHLGDFERALTAKGGTAAHTKVTVSRARRMLELAKSRRISELSLSKALDAVQALRDEGLGTETINHHIRAVKAFSRWLRKDKRARDHHLADLATSSPEGDRRYVRRQLTPAEAARVIQAAEAGPVVMGMSGADRAALYVVALATGLRREELRTLIAERFSLDSDPPTITVTAGYTKNKKEAMQPIPAALAEWLRPWLAGKGPGKPVFAEMPRRTAKMLRFDLKAAGVPYKTSEGVVDFHGTRVTYITNLVASGASVKTCQTLARHSTPSLTIGVYAKTTLHDIKGAVEALPDPIRTDPGAESLRMTGTEGGLVPSATQNATPAVTLPIGEMPDGFATRAPGETCGEWAESELNRRHQDFQASLEPPETSPKRLTTNNVTSNRLVLQEYSN
jgi:site-specific recombinase XerD